MSEQPPPWGTKEWFDALAKNSVGASPLEYYSYRRNGYQKVRLKIASDFVSSGNAWARTASLLDVGCATGDLLGKVLESKNIERVVGVDFSDEVLMQARERVLAADFLVETYPGLTVRDSYDAVLLFEVLYYVPQESRLEALLEVKNLLTQGGRIYFSSSVLGAPYLSENDLTELVKGAGLAVERVQKIDYRRLFWFTAPLERVGKVINENESMMGRSKLTKKVVKLFLGNRLIRPMVNSLIISVLESETLVRFFSKDIEKDRPGASHIYLELRSNQEC